MSRERAEHVAQGTWRSGSLHVWGWNGEGTASAAWLSGGFGHNRWSGAENGWHDTPASYGELSRIELELPSGRRQSVEVESSVRGSGMAVRHAGDELSASWPFAAERVAVAHVTSGSADASRRPVTGTDGSRSRHARECIAHSIRPAHRSARTAKRTASDSSPPRRRVARSLLHNVGWKPDPAVANGHTCRRPRGFTALTTSCRGRGGTTSSTEVEAVRDCCNDTLAPSRPNGVRNRVSESGRSPWEPLELELMGHFWSRAWFTPTTIRAMAPSTSLGGERDGSAIDRLASHDGPPYPRLADRPPEHEPCGDELDLVGR